MAEDFDYDNDETTEEVEQEANPARARQRQLEKELKSAKADKARAEAENAEGLAAKRELSLIKAGIDVNTPTGKLFAKSYDGELTMDAIKAQAEEYGLVPTSQTSEVKQELSAIDRVISASAGSSSGGEPTDHVKAIGSFTTADEVLAYVAKLGLSTSDEVPGNLYPIV